MKLPAHIFEYISFKIKSRFYTLGAWVMTVIAFGDLKCRYKPVSVAESYRNMKQS